MPESVWRCVCKRMWGMYGRVYVGVSGGRNRDGEIRLSGSGRIVRTYMYI